MSMVSGSPRNDNSYLPGVSNSRPGTGGRGFKNRERYAALSEAARQTDLPRVNNPVTEDEYRFYTQNRDRPYLNPTQQDIANDARVSDISRRLENEQNFLNKYIDKPYLNPTEEDMANDAMVRAILSRIDMFGGQ